MLSELGHQVQNHVCKRHETVSWGLVRIAMLAMSCQQGFNNNEDNSCCLSNVFHLYGSKHVTKEILLSPFTSGVSEALEINDLFKVIHRKGFKMLANAIANILVSLRKCLFFEQSGFFNESLAETILYMSLSLCWRKADCKAVVCQIFAKEKLGTQN